MTAKHNVNFASSIEQRLSSVSMPEDVRREVLRKARIAESTVEAVAWICGKLKRPNADPFTKPSPKY